MRLNCRNFIDRYGKKRVWLSRRKLYGEEKRIVEWGMRQIDFAKLPACRPRPPERRVATAS